jgi:TolB-like protein/Flp pilus assembly protein TadD
LRARLEAYYLASGAADRVRISLPKGGYVPVFELVEPRLVNLAAPPDRPNRVGRRLGLALAVLLLAAAVWWQIRPRSHPAASPVTVAVLPFANISPDAENDFFTDGLTEELIAALGRVSGLRVVARSIVAGYKGKSVDTRELARDLKVNAVVEGSVRISGGRMRVAAQLIQAEAGYQAWSQLFERNLEDVFDVQEEIARAIVEHLKSELKLPPDQRLAGHRPASLEAYNLYLKGRYQANLFSRDSVERALAYYQEALAKDPAYASAAAASSMVCAWLGYYDDRDPDRWWRRAREAAEKAIAADPALAEAHAALGFEQGIHEWDWKAAEASFRRAIAENPASAEAHAFYALSVLLPQGRIDEANREFARGLELDPLSAFANFAAAYSLLAGGRTEEAIAQYRRTLELKSIHPDMYFDYGLALGLAGHYRAAEAAFRKSAELRGSRRLYGLELYFSGRPDQARRDLPSIENDGRTGRCTPMNVVRAHAVMGSREKALQWLDIAFKKRDRQFLWLRVDPRLKSLRGDPRFEALAKQIGL